MLEYYKQKTALRLQGSRGKTPQQITVAPRDGRPDRGRPSRCYDSSVASDLGARRLGHGRVECGLLATLVLPLTVGAGLHHGRRHHEAERGREDQEPAERDAESPRSLEHPELTEVRAGRERHRDEQRRAGDGDGVTPQTGDDHGADEHDGDDALRPQSDGRRLRQFTVHVVVRGLRPEVGLDQAEVQGGHQHDDAADAERDGTQYRLQLLLQADLAGLPQDEAGQHDGGQCGQNAERGGRREVVHEGREGHDVLLGAS